jgi:hypothetical protein
MVVPLAYSINMGVKTTKVYQTNTKDIYAADTGIQFATWKILNDTAMETGRENANYNQVYTYPAFSINNNTVAVTVTTNWLFYYLFRIPLGATPHNQNLIMTCTSNNGLFDISLQNISNNPLVVQKMGIWLPVGFSYVNGSSSGITTNSPTLASICGGTNLIWDNLSYSISKHSTASQHFHYLPSDSSPDGAASWIFPQQQSVGASWDNEIWWYEISSVATDNSTLKTTTIKCLAIIDTGTDPPSLRIITYEINPTS